jgi:hypothetical protein
MKPNHAKIVTADVALVAAMVDVAGNNQRTTHVWVSVMYYSSWRSFQYQLEGFTDAHLLPDSQVDS